jgi:hypothetical protein
VPTGQVPDVGVPTAPGRSVTQQNPVAVPEQRRDDASLRRAFRGDRHRRIIPPVASRHRTAPNCPAGYAGAVRGPSCAGSSARTTVTSPADGLATHGLRMVWGWSCASSVTS